MVRIFYLCVLALILAACGPGEPDARKDLSGRTEPGAGLVKAEAGRVQTPDVTGEQVGGLVRGNNEFAFEMYGAAAEAASGEGNVIFSPTASRWPSRWPTPAPAARRRPRWPRRRVSCPKRPSTRPSTP